MIISPIIAVLICLVLAYIFSEFFKLFGLPRVVGQIIAGLFISFLIIRFQMFSLQDFNVLSFLADLGSILLFYYIGLENSFRSFAKNMKKSVMISLFNTALPLIAGFLASRYIFNLNLFSSIIIGASLSVSAQSVSVAILDEMNKVRTRIGSLIISTGAIDDMIELLLITIVFSVFHFAINDASVMKLFFDILIFLFIILIAKAWFVPWTLKFFGREHSSTARFMGSMIIVLLIASLSEYLGMGLLIGAIVAGIIVRQTIFKDVTIPHWEEHDIARSTHIIAFGFLIPIFFVWIGLNTNINLIAGDLWMIVIFILIAIVGTVGGTIIATMLTGGTFKDGHILGWGLNPKGDVELVIAALALKSAIITPEIFTALVIMSLFTTMISPIIFKKLLIKHKV